MVGRACFFAVSGWCIAERLSSALRNGDSVGTFLRERALRIYPTYWVALAALLFFRTVSAPFNTTHLEDNFPSGAAGWLGDLLLVQPYLGTSATLVVSWTLVFELGFYALGAGTLLLRRKGLSSAMLIGMGLLFTLPCLFGWQSRPLYVLGLWPEFLAGVLAWRVARPNFDATARFGAGAFVCLLALAILLNNHLGGAGRWVALGSALALWAASHHDLGLSRLSPLRGLAWLGGISYSLYLIHVTVLSPFINLSMRLVPADHLFFCVVWLAAIALAVLAGWALHHWIEAPVERWRKNHWRRPHPSPVL